MRLWQGLLSDARRLTLQARDIRSELKDVAAADESDLLVAQIDLSENQSLEAAAGATQISARTGQDKALVALAKSVIGEALICTG